MVARSFDDVLEAARGGAGWALEAFYRDLSPKVLGYLRRQDAREPEDLTADVFVAVVRGIGRFRGDERGFRSWVFGIAHRRLLDDRRRRARRPEDAADPLALADALAGAPTGNVEDEALERLEARSIDEALRSLTADQRSVVLLRVLADLSVAEAARILRKTEGAVKTLQRRAVVALARQIEREGVS